MDPAVDPSGLLLYRACKLSDWLKKLIFNQNALEKNVAYNYVEISLQCPLRDSNLRPFNRMSLKFILCIKEKFTPKCTTTFVSVESHPPCLALQIHLTLARK